ncbi:hypothetical protein [Nocardia barduliensis]|uniref:hypothetical protein n=1 Tax=Nocardia barduliensis TaxID=2736643 RepID=UPI001571A817|nr:hypothetical protein [Nocardia barduliensis]
MDELVAVARADIGAGRLLLASDLTLQTAEQLLAAESRPDLELEMEIHWLRGVVARDQHAGESAIALFDRARAIAWQMGRWHSVAELSIAKATAANLALNPRLSSMYLFEARREMEHIGRARRQTLLMEVIARRVQHYELAGDLESAERLATRALRRGRAVESPELLIARFSTLSRIRSTRLGQPSRQVERWLEEAEEQVRDTRSVLRELQWRTALAHHLQLAGDSGISHELRKIRQLVTMGQIRHRPSEMILQQNGIPLPPLPHGAVREEKTVTYNFGGSGHNISIGSMNVSQFSSHNSAGNKEQLWEALRQAGVDDAELADLDHALEEDASAGELDSQGAGPNVTSWYRRLLAKSGDTTGKIAIGAAGGALGRALAAYFGL